MKKPKFRFEIHKSMKNGEYFLKPISRNGKEVFKETYKVKPKKQLKSFLKAIAENDFEIIDCSVFEKTKGIFTDKLASEKVTGFDFKKSKIKLK